jgi:hypothetical protein
MDIMEYINKRHFSKYYKEMIEKEGLHGIINLWTERWKYMFQKKYYFIEEYINDLHKREIIDDVVKNCEIENRKEFIDKLNEIDKIFKEKTFELKKSLMEYSGWQGDSVFGRLYGRKLENNEYNWFYFRIPPERIENWGITEIDLKK